MSSEVRRVKILTLLALAMGLVLTIAGIVLFIMDSQSLSIDTVNPTMLLLSLEGVVTFIFGSRGALIANVPARMGKLASFALTILLVQAACLAALIFARGLDQVRDDLMAVIMAAIPLFDTLMVCLLSNGIAKRAER